MDNVQHLLWEKAKQILWSVSFGLIISELRKLCSQFISRVSLFDTDHSFDLVEGSLGTVNLLVAHTDLELL